MRKVITYGTYDLLHQGHINLLKRAKALGDYLIVGVTSDNYDKERGKLNVRNNVLERIESVKKTGIADEIIIEEYFGQKVDDIQKNNVDIFAIGSDWEGKFDYLKEFCQVVYLPRTEGISSTLLRNKDQINHKIGISGAGRIATRFINEVSFVSGVKVSGCFDPNKENAERLCSKTTEAKIVNSFEELLAISDLIYIASPHQFHYEQVKTALLNGKHVLCEIPFTLSVKEAEELYSLAKKEGLVLLEASKTAHCPSFNHLVSVVKSGIIGEVVDIRASLSKLTTNKSLREMESNQYGGSMYELSPLPLMAIVKLLGHNFRDVVFFSKFHDGIDLFTKAIISFPNAISTMTLGLGVKTEGNLVISGTKGYIYVPAPWWRTDYFEVRYENQALNKKYFYPFDGDGLRYELQEFVNMVNTGRMNTHRLRSDESIAIASVIDNFRKRINVISI